MARSIIQDTKECYLCRREATKRGYFGLLPSTGLHRHRIVFGTANRKKSERYGIWVYVCEARHHEHGPESPHENRNVDLMLKQEAQRIFEEKYSYNLWMQEFGKNYLEE